MGIETNTKRWIPSSNLNNEFKSVKLFILRIYQAISNNLIVLVHTILLQIIQEYILHFEKICLSMFKIAHSNKTLFQYICTITLKQIIKVK